MTLIRKAKISLVGAGPGDPELITLRGLRLLQTADVVLYDALSAPELLKEAPAHAPKIFVGKRAGAHSMRQKEINLLLVQSALRHGHAVRLKGGDSFVFGRGFEEKRFAEALQIPVEVVPGISSAIAVPELEGIPVSSRGYSESFWVITGNNQYHKLPEDMVLAAKSKATIIILMGTRKLKEITELFAQHGRGAEPAIVIHNGSKPNSLSVTGKVNTIAHHWAKAQPNGPGLIVIGEVAALAQSTQKVSCQETINAVR